VPKQIASVLVGFRTRPLWMVCEEKRHTAGGCRDCLKKRKGKKDKKKLCIVSILLLIDIVRGYN